MRPPRPPAGPSHAPGVKIAPPSSPSHLQSQQLIAQVKGALQDPRHRLDGNHALVHVLGSNVPLKWKASVVRE